MCYTFKHTWFRVAGDDDVLAVQFKVLLDSLERSYRKCISVGHPFVHVLTRKSVSTGCFAHSSAIGHRSRCVCCTQVAELLYILMDVHIIMGVHRYINAHKSINLSTPNLRIFSHSSAICAGFGAQGTGGRNPNLDSDSEVLCCYFRFVDANLMWIIMGTICIAPCTFVLLIQVHSLSYFTYR